MRPGLVLDLATLYQQGTRDFRGIDLHGADLSGLSLGGINLQGANLAQANLSHTDLRHANLQDVNFDQAKLHHTCLRGANLTGAFLATIDRHGAWEKTPLSDPGIGQPAAPDLTASQLLAAYTEGQRNFAELNLAGIACPGLELNQVNFQSSNLSQANFRLTDLQGANFHRAMLHRANLSMADLRGCNFCGADLRQADLTGADRRGAVYDDQTQFPTGFNPEIVGMVKQTITQKASTRRKAKPA